MGDDGPRVTHRWDAHFFTGTAAAIAVVLVSDGKPTSEWSGNRQPGVLLAYTSTIANALLAVAFAEAVVIAFWTQALRGVPVCILLSASYDDTRL